MLGLVVAGVAASGVSEESGGVELVMVERSSVRRKAGTRVRNAGKDVDVKASQENEYRLDTSKISDTLVRVDLEHALLTKVVKDDGRDLVVVAKHLCGAGTDIALRGVSKIRDYKGFRGIAMATCCHGICTFAHLVGREQLVEQLR